MLQNVQSKVVDQQEVLKNLFQKQEASLQITKAVDQQEVLKNENSEINLEASLEPKKNVLIANEEAKLAAEAERLIKLEERRIRLAEIHAERQKLDEEHRKKIDEDRIRRLEYLEKQTKLYTHFVHDDNNNNEPPRTKSRQSPFVFRIFIICILLPDTYI